MTNRSQIVTCLVAAALLALVGAGCVFWDLFAGRHPMAQVGPRVVDVYYYDLGTGKTFLARSDDVPPILAPSQKKDDVMPMGVRVYLYACGDCPKDLSNLTPEQLAQKQTFIGWLEMYEPQAKEQMEAMQRGEFELDAVGPDVFDQLEQGHLIALPAAKAADTRWVAMNSEEGFKILQKLMEICPSDKMPKPCFPGR